MHGENGLMYQPQVVSIRGLLSWIEVVFFFLSGLSVVDVNDEFFTGWCLSRKTGVPCQKLITF